MKSFFSHWSAVLLSLSVAFAPFGTSPVIATPEAYAQEAGLVQAATTAAGGPAKTPCSSYVTGIAGTPGGDILMGNRDEKGNPASNGSCSPASIRAFQQWYKNEDPGRFGDQNKISVDGQWGQQTMDAAGNAASAHRATPSSTTAAAPPAAAPPAPENSAQDETPNSNPLVSTPIPDGCTITATETDFVCNCDPKTCEHARANWDQRLNRTAAGGPGGAAGPGGGHSPPGVDPDKDRLNQNCNNAEYRAQNSDKCVDLGGGQWAHVDSNAGQRAKFETAKRAGDEEFEKKIYKKDVVDGKRYKKPDEEDLLDGGECQYSNSMRDTNCDRAHTSATVARVGTAIGQTVGAFQLQKANSDGMSNLMQQSNQSNAMKAQLMYQADMADKAAEQHRVMAVMNTGFAGYAGVLASSTSEEGEKANTQSKNAAEQLRSGGIADYVEGARYEKKSTEPSSQQDAGEAHAPATAAATAEGAPVQAAAGVLSFPHEDPPAADPKTTGEDLGVNLGLDQLNLPEEGTSQRETEIPLRPGFQKPEAKSEAKSKSESKQSASSVALRKYEDAIKAREAELATITDPTQAARYQERNQYHIGEIEKARSALARERGNEQRSSETGNGWGVDILETYVAPSNDSQAYQECLMNEGFRGGPYCKKFQEGAARDVRRIGRKVSSEQNEASKVATDTAFQSGIVAIQSYMMKEAQKDHATALRNLAAQYQDEESEAPELDFGPPLEPADVAHGGISLGTGAGDNGLPLAANDNNSGGDQSFDGPRAKIKDREPTPQAANPFKMQPSNGPGGAAGGPNLGSGTTQTAQPEKEEAPSYAELGGDYETLYDAPGGAGATFFGGRGRGGGAKPEGGGSKIQEMLASLFKKGDEKKEKNGILDFAGKRVPATVPNSILGREGNLFTRVHGAYQEQAKKGEVKI